MTNDAPNHDAGSSGASKRAGDLAQPPADPPWILRAGLVVLAGVATWVALDGAHSYTLGAIDALGGVSETAWLVPSSAGANRMTAEEKFLLEGDAARSERHEQQRAIWEAHPTNRVYLGNYLTALAAGPGKETNRLDYCRQEIAEARKVDPDNARLDYLEAACVLRAAATVTDKPTGEDEEGKKLTEHALEIHDRAALDEAMAILTEGTRKPHMRRYAAEMLARQFEVMGPPRRLAELVQRAAVAASVLLPDLTEYRTLARASRLYADVLIAEGKRDEAALLLEAWHPLTVHLAEDSFTLIGVLVAGALAGEAEKSVPPLYRKIDREDDARRAETLAASLAKPVTDWRQQREAANEDDDPEHRVGERAVKERGSLLTMLLLPALGTWPDASEYAPSRMLEYTVGAEALLAALCLALLAGMAFCLAVTLRWRVRVRDAASRPLLLMPDMRSLIRILALGVVAPLVGFFVVTRFVPLSGHAYSVAVAGHKLIAEAGLLVSALIFLPVAMTAAFVRKRCEALGVPTTDWHARYLLWPFAAGVAMLSLIWFCPPTRNETVQVFAWIGAGMIGFALLAGLLLTLAQGLGGPREHGRFYGTSFRSLIPVLALVIIALGLIAKPYLVTAEARWLARDTLLYDLERPGFTRVESDLVDRLRGEIMEQAGKGRSDI